MALKKENIIRNNANIPKDFSQTHLLHIYYAIHSIDSHFLHKMAENFMSNISKMNKWPGIIGIIPFLKTFYKDHRSPLYFWTIKQRINFILTNTLVVSVRWEQVLCSWVFLFFFFFQFYRNQTTEVINGKRPTMKKKEFLKKNLNRISILLDLLSTHH